MADQKGPCPGVPFSRKKGAIQPQSNRGSRPGAEPQHPPQGRRCVVVALPKNRSATSEPIEGIARRAPAWLPRSFWQRQPISALSALANVEPKSVSKKLRVKRKRSKQQ